MKILILVILLFIFVNVDAKLHKARRIRILSSEPEIINLEFLGTCELFNTIAKYITANRFPLTNLPVGINIADCLPIQNIVGNPDYNDFAGDYVCNRGRDRSLIRIIEGFDPSLATNHPDGTSNNKFIIGIKSPRPFRATSGAHYKRRPSCSLKSSICDSTLINVENCTDNSVNIDRGFVLNTDWVYIIPNDYSVGTCHSATSPTACCPYISPVSLGSNPGICPNNASNELFRLPPRFIESEDEIQRKNENLKRKQNHRPTNTFSSESTQKDVNSQSLNGINPPPAPKALPNDAFFFDEEDEIFGHFDHKKHRPQHHHENQNDRLVEFESHKENTKHNPKPTSNGIKIEEKLEQEQESEDDDDDEESRSTQELKPNVESKKVSSPSQHRKQEEIIGKTKINFDSGIEIEDVPSQDNDLKK